MRATSSNVAVATGPESRSPALLRLVLAPARWLERARGRWRLALAALYTLIVIGTCALTWRQTRLCGLPDIGDPFDIAPLISLHVPDDRNAFVLYAQAEAKAKRSKAIEFRLLVPPYAWPKATDHEGLAYMADNAEAIALWLEGCERPDALYTPLSAISFATNVPMVQEHRRYTQLGLLEASRRSAAGDMAGAWKVYRAVLRGTRLVVRHGTVTAALVGNAEYGSFVAPQIVTWAADPRVDAELLRLAVDDVRAVNAMTAPPSESLRIEYLSAIRCVTDRRWLLDLIQAPPDGNDLVDRTAWYNHLGLYWRARWFAEHEPEQSRRLIRLAFANWLAHCDEPPERRPAMAGSLTRGFKAYAGVFFDDVPSPSSIPPETLARRINSALLADTALIPYRYFAIALDRGRRQRANLVVELANRLYEKRFGKAPTSIDELIGPCLDRLPEGYVLPVEPEAAATRVP